MCLTVSPQSAFISSNPDPRDEIRVAEWQDYDPRCTGQQPQQAVQGVWEGPARFSHAPSPRGETLPTASGRPRSVCWVCRQTFQISQLGKGPARTGPEREPALSPATKGRKWQEGAGQEPPGVRLAGGSAKPLWPGGRCRSFGTGCVAPGGISLCILAERGARRSPASHGRGPQRSAGCVCHAPPSPGQGFGGDVYVAPGWWG